jgi:hypothetical protein
MHIPKGSDPVAIVLVPLNAPVFAGLPLEVINDRAIGIINSALM